MIVFYRIVKPESSGKIINLEPVAGEYPRGYITPQSALTYDIYGFTLFDLAYPFSELVYRYVPETFNMTSRILCSGSCIL